MWREAYTTGYWLALFLRAIFFFLPKVETNIELQCAECIVHGKVFLFIIVGMAYPRSPYKIFGVVINNTRPRNQVEIDVVMAVVVLFILREDA